MSWVTAWGQSWGNAWGDNAIAPPDSITGDAWGGSWDGYWSDAWGHTQTVISFTPANVTVRAFRVMFFEGQLRQISSTFTINDPRKFTPYGMVLVSTPPANWLPLMEAYSENADVDRIRMPGRDENRIPSRRSRVVPEEPGNPYD